MTTNQTHPRFERTLAIIKPDGVQRSLVGEILRRFENVGLKVIGMKMLVADPRHIEKHYTLDPAWKENVGKKSIEAYIKQGKHQFSEDPLVVADTILVRLKSYMTSGPVVAIVLQGAHAVGVTRKLVGGTEPLSSDVGTIRGDYVHDSYTMSDMDDRSIRNVIHASGSPAEAEAEIAHWFKEGEVIDYRLVQEVILYDVNVDGNFE